MSDGGLALGTDPEIRFVPPTNGRNHFHIAADPDSIMRRIDRAEREIALVPTRPHADQMESLIAALGAQNTELIAALRDQNTSWSVERTGLINDVKEMHADFKEIRKEVQKIPLMEQTLTGIQRFIDGDGKEIHVGQRLHEFRLTAERHEEEIKGLKAEIKGLKSEKRHQFRWIVGLGGAFIVGAAVEVLRWFLEHK